MKVEIKDALNSDEPGLLVEYINQKAQDYQEPERKGTPRGDKIGFPLKKYIACIFVALTNLSLKQIAELASSGGRFSYGLLRKWNSESDFKAQQDEFRKEFSLKFYKFMRSELEKSSEASSDYYQAKSDKKPEPADLELIERNLKSLNVAVFEELFHLSFNRFKKIPVDSNNHAIEAKQFYNIIDLIERAFGEKILPYEEVARKTLKSHSLECISILESKRNLSIKDQRNIISCLETVALFMDHIDTN